jgi:hypothetical protein
VREPASPLEYADVLGFVVSVGLLLSLMKIENAFDRLLAAATLFSALVVVSAYGLSAAGLLASGLGWALAPG